MKGVLLDNVLGFIYLGETNLTSSNLSEFLEAINTLGIKSAISFECNSSALTSVSSEVDTKALSTEIQISSDELIEQDHLTIETEEKLLPQQNDLPDQTNNDRELEFIDVYNEPQHKITYSIENLPSDGNANEFILTDNSGAFTLTENQKLETASSINSEKIEEIEDDGDADMGDGQSLEEFQDVVEPIINVADDVGNISTIDTTPATSEDHIIEVQQIATKSKMRPSKQQLVQSQIVSETKVQMIDEDDGIQESYSTTTTFNNAAHRNNNDISLELAVQAVINEGISLQKAAHKYEISKTVLWRRVRKLPNYMKTARENPVLSLAYERLKSGDALKNISRDLDIPMSTLHRHKVRLAQQGRLPDYVAFKKRGATTKDELKLKLGKAVYACIHEGMSQNHAANLFDIPKSTLWRHLQRRVAEAELHNSEPSSGTKEEAILS